MIDSRRQFLRQLSASGGVALLTASPFAPRVLRAATQQDNEGGAPSADSVIAGKDARLIVHKASPCEIETPGALLAEQRVTPARLCFVRNNQQLEHGVTLEPMRDAEDWGVELGGLVEGPRTISVSQLRQLPGVEQEVVLQCSGNGRKFFSQAAAASGAQWSVGAVANLRFGGVPLKTVLDALKMTVDSRAQFLTAEGKDAPSKPEGFDFEHSVPLADARSHGFLALTLNGEPLPAVHGGPVRLVMPGYYGTMHVKWVSRLRFEATETANHHQVKRYRTPLQPIPPGTKFDSDLGNSEPNWRMKLKSIIFVPGEDAELKVGRNSIRGVAFNDGRAKIDRVEVSTDGESWQKAELQPSNGPFGWSTWSADVDLPRGEPIVMCRAFDALGRSQPLDGQIHWNPAGYAWNGVHRVQVRVT